MANPRYQTPSSYIGKRAPARPKPRPVYTPLRPPAPTAQTWADTQAQRIVDEQLAAIKSQQDAYNASLLARAQQQAEAAQRFAAMVQGLGIDKQIAGIYGSAGRDIAGMAQGFAGDIRDTAAADAARQTRMVSGTGQEGAVRNEGVGMGDVVYGVGGYIPGKTMGEVGSAFAADAARQPAFLLEQKIGESQKDYQDRLAEADQTYGDAALKARLGKTDLVQQLQQQKVDESLKMQKMQLDQADADRNYWLKMQAFYLSQKKTKLAAQAGQRAALATKRYNNAGQGLDINGNVLPDYMRLPDGTIVKRSEWRQSQKNKGLDENGNLLPGFKRNANGVIVPRYKPPAPKTPKTPKTARDMTPGQKADAMKTVLSKEDDITKTDLPQLAKQTGYIDLLKQPNARPKEKERLQKSIKRALWVRYAPLAPTPAAKAALRRMIARLVESYSPSAGGSLTEGLLG